MDKYGYDFMFKNIATLEPVYCLIYCESFLLAFLVTTIYTVLVVTNLFLGLVLRSRILFGVGVLLHIVASFFCFSIFVCIPLMVYLYGVRLVMFLVIYFHLARLCLLLFICKQLIKFYFNKEMTNRFFKTVRVPPGIEDPASRLEDDQERVIEQQLENQL